MMEGEKIESHQKGFLNLKCFPLSKYSLPPFFEETLGSFFPSFFPCSVYWGLGDFNDIWRENHFFKNFFSYVFNILAVDTYSGMELCTPTWLNHDYGDGGVIDILAVDTYSRVGVCTPIQVWANSRWWMDSYFSISTVIWMEMSSLSVAIGTLSCAG
jgi:hypothetical protein